MIAELNDGSDMYREHPYGLSTATATTATTYRSTSSTTSSHWPSPSTPRTHPPTASSTTTTCAPPRLACPILFVLHRVKERVWDAQVFYRAPPDITLLQLPKPVSIRVGLVYLAKCDVHEVVAVDEVAVERFPVFELDQHGFVLGCI